MGKKAREIVSGVDVDQLLASLKKAYADEWIAYHYYWLGAQIAEGRSSPMVARELERIAEEELEHAEELAERILFLGDQPIRTWSDIENQANCPRVNLPEDPGDLNGIVEAVIEGERCAIDVYNKILKQIGPYYKGPSTFHLIRHILDEEIEHEDTFENLLKE